MAVLASCRLAVAAGLAVDRSRDGRTSLEGQMSSAPTTDPDYLASKQELI
jgi:hypothetical protein